MENIFNEIIIPINYFYFYIKTDLHCYLLNNLYEENNDILKWDLKNALTTNANGKYIL
jgi:hypothetical protein